MVGFNYNFLHPQKFNTEVEKNFFNNWLNKNLPKFLKLCSEKVKYYDSSAFITYMKNIENCEIFFNNIIKLWENKDIIIVSGESVFNKITYNIFNYAKSIEYIKAPSINAFDNYDNIVAEVEKHDKSKLILLILGPTATVMSYDLYLKGFRAIDIGHIAKDYDYYKKHIEITDDSVINFYGVD